jgi:hypothetical protein
MGRCLDKMIIGTDCTVFFKHTGEDFYVAFSGSIAGASAGVYLDLGHNGGAAPQTDDIWIHGSAPHLNLPATEAGGIRQRFRTGRT